METSNVAAIKAAHPLADFFATRGVKLRRQGAVLSGKCPFHHEQNGEALIVWPEENKWRCFGKCDAGGDVIEAVMRLDGGDFKSACERLASAAGVWIPAPVPLATSIKPPPMVAPDAGRPFAYPYNCSKAELGIMHRAAKRLYDDDSLCRRIAEKRGWKAATIRYLAQDPALGWHNGKLAFLFESGMKLRSKNPDGSRRFEWAFGRPFLWRGGALHDARYRRVIVCEGETDAISLIDAGAEADSETLVIALPCATGFRPESAQLFTSRHVILALDADKAGAKATLKLCHLLAPVAGRISRFNPAKASHP